MTEKQVEGAHRFLNRLLSLDIKYAILMDGSPSCGSNVLLKEEGWPRGGFKRGAGVAASLLKRNGIAVFSSFDELSISKFIQSIVNDLEFSDGLKNLKDFPKFKSLFLDEPQ